MGINNNVVEQNVAAIKARIEQMEYELRAIKATLMLSDFDMRVHGHKMTGDEIEAMYFIQEYTGKKKVALEEQIAMEKEKLLVWEGFQTSSGSGAPMFSKEFVRPSIKKDYFKHRLSEENKKSTSGEEPSCLNT